MPHRPGKKVQVVLHDGTVFALKGFGRWKPYVGQHVMVDEVTNQLIDNLVSACDDVYTIASLFTNLSPQIWRCKWALAVICYRYLNDPRQVFKVAVALDDTVRNIASWQVVQ